MVPNKYNIITIEIGCLWSEKFKKFHKKCIYNLKIVKSFEIIKKKKHIYKIVKIYKSNRICNVGIEL